MRAAAADAGGCSGCSARTAAGRVRASGSLRRPELARTLRTCRRQPPQLPSPPLRCSRQLPPVWVQHRARHVPRCYIMLRIDPLLPPAARDARSQGPVSGPAHGCVRVARPRAPASAPHLLPHIVAHLLVRLHHVYVVGQLVDWRWGRPKEVAVAAWQAAMFACGGRG